MMSDDPKRNDPQKKSWLVSYDGSFWHAGEDTGREVPVRKEFLWGKKKWVIPALYLCQEGLVIDFCMEAEPAELKTFIEKWDLARTACDRRSLEQELKLHLEHPLDVSFSSHISLNGNDLKSEHSCAVSWLPEACFPGSRFPDKMTPDPEAKAALDHYGLDRDKAWSIHRHAYRWAPDMESFAPGTWRESLKAAGPLFIRLERDKEIIPAERFTALDIGQRVPIRHPFTGAEYLLTVQDIRPESLSTDPFPDSCMEFPGHCTAIFYSLQPDLPDHSFHLLDCAEGDAPRRKEGASGSDKNSSVFSAASIGIIGGAEGPAAILLPDDAARSGAAVSATLHSSCSSAYFEAPEQLQWLAVFCEKLAEDITVEVPADVDVAGYSVNKDCRM